MQENNILQEGVAPLEKNSDKSLLESIKEIPKCYQAKVLYDNIKGHFLSIQDYAFDEDNRFEKQAKDGEDGKSIRLGAEGGDSMGILRFVRGNKSKRLEISPSGNPFSEFNKAFVGLSLKYHKASRAGKGGDQKQQEGEELVLTNMAFYTGLHLWEIIAPISCNSIQFGVYNPVTKTEVLTNFKTTTPRTVTVCLDLNENLVKFWLNDRRNQGKNLKLTEGGPWTPCIKITTEKNKLILNPFAKEPSDFYEKDFDKKFTLRKFIMPHLHNTVCITHLPQAQTKAKVSQTLKDKLKISSSDINTILMPSIPSVECQSSDVDQDSSSKDSFCFIQFHFLEAMAEFIHKNQSNSDFKVYQPYQIAEWFEKPKEELPLDVQEPFLVISSHITVPKTTTEDVFKSMKNAYMKLLVEKNEGSEQSLKDDNKRSMVQIPFTDNILHIQGESFKLIERDASTLNFDIAQVNLSEPPSSLQDNVTLKVEYKLLNVLFNKINWSSIFKESNELLNGLIQSFFDSMAQSSSKVKSNSSSQEEFLVFRCALNAAKFFVDVMISHMKSHLERNKRHYSNTQSIIPSDNTLANLRVKAETALDLVSALPFFEDPNFSVDDIYLSLHVLHDLSEQIWAQAKSNTTQQDVRSFVNSVSRPFSAFNRLGSFITWGSNNGEQMAAILADQGFFLRETLTISQFENPGLELQDLSSIQLNDQNYLREQLGHSNRMLNSLVTENVPLYKTLNYFSPILKMPQEDKLIDVISSQNLDCLLIGNAKGQFTINFTGLMLTQGKKFSMFDSNERQSKIKKHKKVIEKVVQRIQNFDEYSKSINKRSVPLSLFDKDNKVGDASAGSKSQEPMKTIAKAIAHKKKQNQKPKTKAAQKIDKKTKKPQKDSGKLPVPHDYAEEVDGEELVELFGEANKDANKDQKGSKLQKLRPFLQTDCKVLGYILLSKPSSMNVIDPILVGCVFFNGKEQKYFLRVKKLTFTIQYLQNFITLDPVTGQKINKISGTQLLDVDDIAAINEQVLAHKETIVDLHSVFMRTLVVKKDWPKKDHKFSILDDLSEAEIEIEDCKTIIDFSRCSFAVQAQSQVQMLIETNDSKTQLVQFKISDSKDNFDEETQIMPISIDRGKEMILNSIPQRVFQFDEKILLVGSDFWQVLRQDNFQIIQEEKLSEKLTNPESVTILNLTSQDKLFCKKNLKIFKKVEDVPQQDWYMVINQSNDSTSPYSKYQLTPQQQNGIKKQKTEKASQEIDISKAPPSDIIQIGNLLESKFEGTQGVSNSFSHLTSSGGIDQENGLQIYHNWQLLNGTQISVQDKYQFESYLQNSSGKEVHLKQIDLEFSFVRKVASHIKIDLSQAKTDASLCPGDGQIEKLPLIVEHFTGSQTNDSMHPNIITSPDSYVFCSNYPQPEFIFRLQNNSRFIPTQFIVQSRENRLFNGVPISQGLIFVSDTLEDLMNTKQFSKMSEKELKKWSEQRFRGDYKNIPLLPNEPIAYFDMDDKTEIIIEAPIFRIIKYVKFVPTGFRRRPINFSSKAFHSNQVECQFFGVNGYQVACGMSKQDLDLGKAQLEVPLDVQLTENSSSENILSIGAIDKVVISEIRSGRAQQYGVPVTALQQLSIPNVIGVGRVSIGVKEEHSDIVNKILISVASKESHSEWKLAGVSLSVKSYTDSSAIFSSQILQENKPKLRHFLLDITQYQHLLGKLLAIAHDQKQTDEMRVASLQCILNFLKNNSQDKHYNEFLRLFKESTDVKQILNETFLEQSVKYQLTSQAYLDKIGLMKQSYDYIADVLIKSQLPKLLDQAHPLTKVQQLLNLLALCSPEQRLPLQQQLAQLLLNRLCNEELPKYQTQEYIMLRSKLGINMFPFDQGTEKQLSTNEDSNISSSTSGNLSCKFELHKLDTLYQYNVDFGSNVVVEKIKLFFDADQKNSYKIIVRIIVPDPNNGQEQLIYRRQFDENYYSLVCKKAFKPEIIQYYNSSSNGSEAKEGNKQTNASLNYCQIELPGCNSYRYMRVQVELADSFKSVHKSQSVPSILIRPEFHGHTLTNSAADEQSICDLFKIQQHSQKDFLGQRDYNGLPYSFYKISNEPEIKSCIVIANEAELQQAKVGRQSKDESSSKNVPVEQSNDSEIQKDRATLTQEIDALKALIAKAKQPSQKKALRAKIVEITALQKKVYPNPQSDKQLGLRYLLSLADLIASNLIQAIKANSEIGDSIFHDFDLRESYRSIFRRFTVFDRKDQHKNVLKLQQELYSHISDKSQFICSLIQEFLFPQNVDTSQINYSQKNVINFFQSQKDLDFNELLNAFAISFKLPNKESTTELNNEKQVHNLMLKLQAKEEQVDSISVHSIVTLLTIIDEASKEYKDTYNIDQLLKLLVFISIKSPQIQDCKNQNGLVAFKYLLQLLHRLTSTQSNSANHQKIAENCQEEVGALIIMTTLRNDKEIDKIMKEIVFKLAKHDTTKNLTALVGAILSWYKDKNNIQVTNYYQTLEKEQQGQGSGIFYKHMSQFFELYLGLIQTKQKPSGDQKEGESTELDKSIEKAYRELGTLMNDLLEVLILEQDSENYESNYFEVWIQLLKTLCYLVQHKLVDSSVVDLFASQFFKLRQVFQESIYPDFHNQIQDQLDQKDPQVLITMINSFVTLGFKDDKDEQKKKLTFCFVDGLFNIFESTKKDKQSQSAISCQFKDVSQVLEMTKAFIDFLNGHVNHGVYNGIIGANLDLLMKLDLAVQFSSILLNGQTKDGQNAFEVFIKDNEVQQKEMAFRELIKWIILNSGGGKFKSSPSGSRIFTLATNIESLLGKISASESSVSIALPILMKTILEADFKLRDLIHESGQAGKKQHLINFERAISIQKTVNTLFLTFFKQWVQTDGVAKKFLTELNGFDFLLDRLFSKVKQPSTLVSAEEKSDQEQKKEDTGLVPEEGLLGISENLFADNAAEEDEDFEEDQIMKMVIQKVQSFGASQTKQPNKKEAPKKAIKQQLQESLPASKPDTQTKSEKVDESQADITKEVESKLVLDDWAKNLKLTWSSDKESSVKSSYANTQWYKFKNGTKNRLYNYQITTPTHNYEYVMKFDLESVIMLNEVQMGVVYNWSTYDPDCNIEPLTLILEGGKEENSADWRVLLTPMQDDGFKMNGITVFGYNFADSSAIKDQSLDKILEKIGCKEAQYLTFRFRKPLLACSEQSLYIPQVTKQKAYGLSFISVMGNQIPKSQQVYSYLVDIQKENSLEVLSKFFSNEFTEAFELISEQESIIEKIKNAFDKLAQLMNTKATLIKPIFLAICSKNQSLGDWIMNNRLISMDPAFIKKEQIAFLGDIVSSSKDKQLDKVLKLKDFILTEINKVAQKELVLTSEQQTLLSLYLKLFNNKLREYAFYKASSTTSSDQSIESVLEFKPQDLDNVVSLMSECVDSSKSKLFNTLTEFALILLLPPRPLVNKTISVDDYVEKLLNTNESNQVQNLLFCSIMASTNINAIQNILRLGKIEWVLDQLKGWAQSESFEETELFQFSQILFNCSKQALFRDKFRQRLPSELYSFLKNESELDGSKILRQSIPDTTISLLVYTIRDVIIGGENEIEDFSKILKEDIVLASDKGDVDFINKVIVPILHAEEKVPITISTIDEQSLKKGKNANLQPIFASSDGNQGQKDGFFLRTNILNKKQKATFGKMFKELTHDKVENFQKMQESKWDLVFEDKAHQNQNPAKFKSFVKAVNNRANIIIFVQCKVQEQQVVFGGFTNKNFPAMGESWAHEFDYQIPYSDANFVCYYTPDKELHYTMTHNKAFGYIYTDYEEGGALSVSGDFFLISWSYEFQNSCGNIYDMKCIEEQSSMSFYNNMEISHIEVWACDIGNKSTVSLGKVKGDLKRSPLYKNLSPFNFFRQNLVFEVSKNMTVSHVAKEILGKNQVFIKYPGDDKIDGNTTIEELLKQFQEKSQFEGILDLVIKREQIKSEDDKANQISKEPQKEANKEEPLLPSLQRIQPLLKRFEEKGGIFDLIKAAKAAVKLYKTDKLREMWSLWLNEIESFSQLPTFFQTFCQDREKEIIVYNLIEGQYDFKDDKGGSDQSSAEALRFIQQQEELHIEMVKYSYKIVSQVFEEHESADLRDNCLKNGTFERFIERIGQLSSEKKRVKVEVSMQSKDSESPEKKEKEDNGKTRKKKNKKDDKKDQKRKGVGYTTGVGTTWNVTEYLKSKEAKSSQAANIVNILKHMIKSKDWTAPPEIKSMLLESALLPTLEAAFRSGSLLEMAKEYELNMSYLGFVQELANHSTLIDLLLDIGDEYEPRQKETISQLLSKLNDLSTIFLSCLSEESKQSLDEEQIKPRNLAERIHETNKIVQEKVTQQTQTQQQQSLQDILSLPLSDAYWKLLSNQRFDYMSMKNSSGSYTHVYQGEFHKGTNPPVSKLVRLAQEIADLSNSLPCDYTNAIFCRVDKERVDVMKCIIMGASGTPYAHGAFLYDLFFENSYPNSPPKCQLVTTGGQTVRFNPNLYNNGKVCLSLLGTWRGQSTENWDPKLSTILQVLLSIQAIIMSNEVYFNEPGYEHEAGTPDGERKNEGYANIVRYCNVKFAIIEAIKNPPPGFEKIIRSSFYLKKNEVLREVKEWVDKAKTSDALYTGLVYDHNYHWAPQISAEGKYAEMMEAIYKELKETLESLPSPFEDQVTGQVIERKFSKNEDDLDEKKTSKNTGTIAKIEEIDVSYEPSTKQNQEININDEKVKDRWSRYIGAMGIEAVAKQAESRILISGLGPLGVEIAKNIVLAGCKELILYDDMHPPMDELSGQFFITENEINSYEYSKTRAHYSSDKLQQLNFYVKVTVLDQSTQLHEFIQQQADLKVVVLADVYQFNQEKLYQINEVCRSKKIAMINSFQNGLFGKVFNDFGEEFLVLDKDGEELQEVMIKDISYDESKSSTVVTLLPGFKHKYEDNDQVTIKEVLGMKKLSDSEASINDAIVSIKVINPSQFSLKEVDSREFTPYEGNGIAKQIKVPIKRNFKTLQECEEEEKKGGSPTFDQNLLISDFEKMDNKLILHYIYKALLQQLSSDDFGELEVIPLCEAFLKKVKELIPKDQLTNEKQQKKVAQLAYIFGITQRLTFPPIAAFLGGVVSQEIVKAITQKFNPISQCFYFDCAELFPEDDILSLSEDERLQLASPEQMGDRYDGLKACIGTDLFEEIKDCKVFMVGAGAIGCELLKNYAMLGLGTGKEGGIIVTDPDVIEVSNLNRQFLFREKHLRKPKSQTAAAAAIQMNPHLKGHISARLDKIHEGTAHIYNENFFMEQTIITNALDNVQARLYIDGKCVAARTPLIDSGTLGPKGHVQIVLPDLKTESYASQRDPEDNAGEIPHCTLKMFPEETLHCVEWAKDLFGNLFTLQPQSFNKLIIEEKDNPVNFSDQQEKTAVKKALKKIAKRPMSFDDCLKIARYRFQKHFFNDVKQLLHVYPLEKLTKEGRPFWSLPKRPPHAVDFDPTNLTHASVISSFACLFANLYSIPIPYDNPRSSESKLDMAQKSLAFVVPEFLPSDQKASQIESQVDKEKQSKDDQNNENDDQQQQFMQQTSKTDEIEDLKEQFEKVLVPIRQTQSMKLKVEEFEKDNDENFHIDFIHSMANVRAANYKLDEMDWITVKIKAGKIVPALATTTAAIAALQTIELIKYLKDCKLEQHRNSFLNLAVPSLMQSEPGLAEKTKLGEDLEVNLWDRWEYEAQSREVTLLKVVEYLEQTYKLNVRDIFFGSIPLFMHALQMGKDRKSVLNQTPLIDMTHPSATEAKKELEFIDLTVTFVDPKQAVGEDGSEKMLEGVPTVRVILPPLKDN